MKNLKKFVTVLTMALVIAVMSIGLVACGKSASIKKAFEKEGYTVTTVKADDDNTLVKTLYSAADEDGKKILDKSELILVNKSLLSGIVVKFPSTSDLKDYLGDNYDKTVEAGLVNGDCVLLTLDLTGAVSKIFKNA